MIGGETLADFHIYIKRNPAPEELYLEFMLLLGLFFGYFEVTAFWNAGIILLTAWLVVASKRIQVAVKSRAMPAFLLFLLAGFIVVNIIYMGTGTYFTYNLIQIIRPIIILCGIYYLVYRRNLLSPNMQFSNILLLNCRSNSHF